MRLGRVAQLGCAAWLSWHGMGEARAADPAPLGPVRADVDVATMVEPVMALAQIDVRALRRARTASTLAVMAPAANHVAHLATSPILEEGGASAEGVGSLSLLGASTVGMLVLPALLDSQAQASRRSIEAQGGSVRRTSLPIATALLSAVPLIVRGLPEAGEDASAGRVVLAYGAYAAVLALPLNQLRLNRKARRRAGWVGR